MDPGTTNRGGAHPSHCPPHPPECTESPSLLIKLLPQNPQAKQRDSTEGVVSDAKALSNEMASARDRSPSPTFTPPPPLRAEASPQTGGHIQADLQNQTGRRKAGEGVLPEAAETIRTILHESTKNTQELCLELADLEEGSTFCAGHITWDKSVSQSDCLCV